MPAKDLYHNTVKTALIKDGWTILADPLSLKIGGRDLFVDLGAEKVLLAQQKQRTIAVEIKSFLGYSPVSDLEQALGQYLLYEQLLQRQYPHYQLYLAIRLGTYQNFFQEEIVQLVLQGDRIKLLIFDEHEEVITQWIP
ncbi:MAG: XisH family protein [Prochlorothrix sp.]